jgi:hypothetical protein
MAKKEDTFKIVKELLVDLGWEADRMTESGVESLNRLYKIFNIEPIDIIKF